MYQIVKKRGHENLNYILKKLKIRVLIFTIGSLLCSCLLLQNILTNDYETWGPKFEKVLSAKLMVALTRAHGIRLMFESSMMWWAWRSEHALVIDNKTAICVSSGSMVVIM